MKYTILLSLFLLIALPLISDAAAPQPLLPNPIWNGASIGGYRVTCNEAGPCNACDAIKVGINVVNFGSIVIFPIVAVIVIYGAFQMLTSAGSEERFRGGRKTLVSGVIGLAIVLVSWLAINTFLHFLGGGGSLTPQPTGCVL